MIRQYTYISLGWISFVIGVLGIFLPLLPTVIFWIIAVWLWTKGSSKLVDKVYQHPKFGSQIKLFMQHGIVSRKGKIAAVSSMALSYLLIQLLLRPTFLTGLIIAVTLFLVSLWLWSRPEIEQVKGKNIF